jgi:hypothetical protein
VLKSNTCAWKKILLTKSQKAPTMIEAEAVAVDEAVDEAVAVALFVEAEVIQEAVEVEIRTVEVVV